MKLTDLTKGILKENPIFILVLGMCPTLAVTSSAINGLGMGLSATAVLIASNMAIAAVKNIIPNMVRIPAYIVLIASFVTILSMVLEAFVPSLFEALGIFIPLIVVNCIILGRAEAFAAKNSVFDSFIDAVTMGIGFTLGLTVLGILREALGNGSFFGTKFIPETADGKAADGILAFVLPPGAFITLGFLIAGAAMLNNALEKRKQKPATEAKEGATA